MRKSIISIFLVLAAASYSFAEPVIKSKAVKGDLPLDPMSKAWDVAGATAVDMVPQNLVTPGITDATVSSVKVRSLHNDRDISFMLEWYDPTEDDAANMPDRFSDECAIQFPVKAGSMPSFMMGDAENPVQIILWKAAWEKDVTMGYQDIGQAYPNYNYDMYPMVDDPKKSITEYSEDAKKFVPAIAAKNPVSDPNRKVSVEELNAIGFGTLTTQVEQNSKGKAARNYGYWRVVVTRPLGTGDDADAVLQPGKPAIAAFAVWDGVKQNRGARKNYSSGGWVNLEIE